MLSAMCPTSLAHNLIFIQMQSNYGQLDKRTPDYHPSPDIWCRCWRKEQAWFINIDEEKPIGGLWYLSLDVFVGRQLGYILNHRTLKEKQLICSIDRKQNPFLLKHKPMSLMGPEDIRQRLFRCQDQCPYHRDFSNRPGKQTMIQTLCVGLFSCVSDFFTELLLFNTFQTGPLGLLVKRRDLLGHIHANRPNGQCAVIETHSETPDNCR